MKVKKSKTTTLCPMCFASWNMVDKTCSMNCGYPNYSLGTIRTYRDTSPLSDETLVGIVLAPFVFMLWFKGILMLYHFLF